jgi:hypothetical protein
VKSERVQDGAGSHGTVIRDNGPREVYVDWMSDVSGPEFCPECGDATELRAGRLVCTNITCFWRRTP